MTENIILKKSPKIEFQILDRGFQLIDEQTTQNSGFYAYHDLHSIELNKSWSSPYMKALRVLTWILNFVPLVADADSFKKSKVTLNFANSKLGIWLTDSYMIKHAKRLKDVLDSKK